MAGNIQIPQNVEKTVMVTVEDTSLLLRQFLTELLTAQRTLEDRVTELENRVTELET